jgi:hypothetical protein
LSWFWSLFGWLGLGWFGFGLLFFFMVSALIFLVYSFLTYFLGYYFLAYPAGFALSGSISNNGFPTSKLSPAPTWNFKSLPA